MIWPTLEFNFNLYKAILIMDNDFDKKTKRKFQ